MESGIENIVATSAMLQTDTGSKSLPMSKTQCRFEANYAVATRIFRDMKENGLISEAEYSVRVRLKQPIRAQLKQPLSGQI